jgi:hypothetical protein
MAEGDRDFSGGSIAPFASVRGPEDTGIDVFRLSSNKDSVLFEMRYAFAENGNDFWVVISNFGIPSADAAGSRTPLMQSKFNASEAQSAKKRIEEYFSGTERKNFMPFCIAKARYLETKFVDGWIRIK